MEILVVLAIALLVFGPKRVPELGRSLGKGIRGFKESLSSDAGDLDADEEPTPPRLPTAVPPDPM
jgi:sec-independent protein translocase protein TatA